MLPSTEQSDDSANSTKVLTRVGNKRGFEGPIIDGIGNIPMLGSNLIEQQHVNEEELGTLHIENGGGLSMNKRPKSAGHNAPAPPQ